MSFQLSVIKDAYQHLMLHPYITASRTIFNIKLNSGIGYLEACSQLWVRGFLKYMPSPLYSASVVVFQLHGGWVSHMQALAAHSTVHNTWILTTESISVLAACS